MESQGLINKIKSSYIIKNLFNYIEDNKIYLQLFIHSKSLQKKLNIQLLDYKVKFIENIGFNISEYMYIRVDKYKEGIFENNLSEK